MNKIFKITSIFSNLDMYGHKVDLYIHSQSRVKSKFGACFSILIISLCLYLFIVNLIAWSNNQNLEIISSHQSLSANELALKNQSFNYTFDYSNYNIYFGLTATFPNGTMINWQQPKSISVTR
jgi:hypothetical protein